MTCDSASNGPSRKGAGVIGLHNRVAQHAPGVERAVWFGKVHALVLVPMRRHFHARGGRAVGRHHFAGDELFLGERQLKPVGRILVNLHGPQDANMPLQGCLHEVRACLQAGDANRSFAVGVPSRPCERRYLHSAPIAGDIDRHVQQRFVEPSSCQRVEHGIGFGNNRDARASKRSAVVRANLNV